MQKSGFGVGWGIAWLKGAGQILLDCCHSAGEVSGIQHYPEWSFQSWAITISVSPQWGLYQGTKNEKSFGPEMGKPRLQITGA